MVYVEFVWPWRQSNLSFLDRARLSGLECSMVSKTNNACYLSLYPGKMADRALLTRWYGDRKIPVQMIVDEWPDSSVKGHCYFSKGGPDLPIRLLVRGTATFLFKKIHEHCTAITRLIFNIFQSELRIELILNICNEWQSARTQLFVFPDQR